MASSSMPPPSSSTNPQGVPPLSPSEPALDTTNTTETTLKPTDIVMVYVTVPSKDMGRTIAHTLVSEKLAACTNIVPGLESIYYWDGKVNADEELLLLIKTRAGLLPELTVKVKELHPYDECEVVAVPVVGGSESYLQWVRDSTKDSNSI